MVNMNSEKVFIVEDEVIVAESLNDQLQSLGYTVVGQATSGEEALQKIKKKCTRFGPNGHYAERCNGWCRNSKGNT